MNWRPWYFKIKTVTVPKGGFARTEVVVQSGTSAHHAELSCTRISGGLSATLAVNRLKPWHLKLKLSLSFFFVDRFCHCPKRWVCTGRSCHPVWDVSASFWAELHDEIQWWTFSHLGQITQTMFSKHARISTTCEQGHGQQPQPCSQSSTGSPEDLWKTAAFVQETGVDI